MQDNETTSFLPQQPQQARSSRKETRHWTPSTKKHIIISPDELNEQIDLDSPYEPNPFSDPNLEKGHAANGKGGHARHDTIASLVPSKRKTLLDKFQFMILNRGFVPLVLRFISLIFSIAALFLAGFITKFSMLAQVQTRPSTVMAFAVN